MALKDIDQALEVLNKLLAMDETAEKDKYDTVHKIMALAYNCEGTIFENYMSSLQIKL
jgi:cytochrome oxidase Cu insertion factor (SCO1/SenC/PrrC family)